MKPKIHFSDGKIIAIPVKTVEGGSERRWYHLWMNAAINNGATEVYIINDSTQNLVRAAHRPMTIPVVSFDNLSPEVREELSKNLGVVAEQQPERVETINWPEGSFEMPQVLLPNTAQFFSDLERLLVYEFRLPDTSALANVRRAPGKYEVHGTKHNLVLSRAPENLGNGYQIEIE